MKRRRSACLRHLIPAHFWSMGLEAWTPLVQAWSPSGGIDAGRVKAPKLGAHVVWNGRTRRPTPAACPGSAVRAGGFVEKYPPLFHPIINPKDPMNRRSPFRSIDSLAL
jgi:hypothetical protein